ncbi:hypothetical protein OG21DRAFT_1495667 [Imleria badia]|nr:hypothetical protein OG21DRAFT_1495667 [Imleria badia]
MALSLSPHQLKQAIHTSPQPCSTPRQFTTIVHATHEPLSMSQTEPSLLNSSYGHVTHNGDMNRLALPSQVGPDLPSWTPLRAPEDDGNSSASDPEADELSTRKATDSATKRRTTNLNAQTTVENTVAGRSSKSSSDAKPFKGKKARFDGVLIATKLSSRKFNAQTQPSPAPSSTVRAFSLVDALARTFDANRHSEVLLPRQSRTALRHHDDASGPQTDVETTEAEDEQLQLNTRLARTPLKRPRERARFIAASANASETNSEDVASLLQDIPQPERPVKRFKPIQYEANHALIDAALGTVEAPISWDAEMDFITRDEDYMAPVARTAQVDTYADVRVAVDGGDLAASSLVKDPAPSLTQTPVENEWRMPTWVGPKEAVLSSYLSRGAKFRQRLDAIFGEDATVRTDRVARPRPVDYDFFAPIDEPDREPSLSASESTESVSSASTAGEIASAIPSTHITSQSPDIVPIDTSTKPEFGASEQMDGWIAALQRLVKGKVRVKEEDLETLSIILAEIESVKDSLDESVAMTSELRESIKQLSELHEIPFGDRNMLRQRAEKIFHAWSSSMGELGAS